ncbi:MAG: hypothetical protein WD048_07340 [Chitinophagales bacterium]
MRSSDREIIRFLEALMQQGEAIVSKVEKDEKKELLEDYLREIKAFMEWPHQKQLNPLITMRIKDFNLQCFIAYLNDMPVKERQFFFFDKTSSNPEKQVHREIQRINLALEAIKYFYKSK